MSFDMIISVFTEYHDILLQGVLYTLGLSLLTVVIGSVCGTILAMMRLSQIESKQERGLKRWIVVGGNKLIRGVALVYIEIIRGTPLLVQLFIFWKLIPTDNMFIVGLVTLGVNSSAYVAEIVRAGIQAVDKGQMEAARSLGMKYGKTMWYIIIPQAIKNILPALGNEFVVVIKESSIISVVGLGELFYSAKVISSDNYSYFETYLAIAAVYFVLTFVTSRFVSRMEGRMK